MDEQQSHRSMRTVAVHGGERVPGPEGSVVYPVYYGTVYASDPDTDYHDLQYLRLSSTPSQRYLHDKLAALEGAEAGLATASGMAAISTTLLSLMRVGDHLMVTDALYGGTMDFLTQHAADLGWSYSYVDGDDPGSWESRRTPHTRVFLTETITNPLMRVPALEVIPDFCHANGITSMIDNTFASPANFNPLEHGFDLVCHSATKYLGGHSDVVAGAVIGSAERVESVRRTLNHFGGSLDPHSGYLLARGIKTLAVRIAAHNDNALAVASFLQRHDAVREVNYPGLATHPDHARAAKLLSGFGGMVSLRVADGATAAALLRAVRLPAAATSLGGVESLITQPAQTSHAGMSPADRERLGITDDLVRLSVGIEDVDDLLTDLGAALDSLV